MCDALHLNPFEIFKQLYSPYKNVNQVKTIISLNNFILTKVKVKSINNVTITGASSNNLRGCTIRLGAVYVCHYSHNEILETIFQGNN